MKRVNALKSDKGSWLFHILVKSSLVSSLKECPRVKQPPSNKQGESRIDVHKAIKIDGSVIGKKPKIRPSGMLGQKKWPLYSLMMMIKHGKFSTAWLSITQVDNFKFSNGKRVTRGCVLNPLLKVEPHKNTRTKDHPLVTKNEELNLLALNKIVT